jgi:hypothetical protein
MPEETSNSTSTTFIDHPDAVSKQNPLLLIISFVMKRIDEGQVDSVLECVARNSDDVLCRLLQNYQNIIKYLRLLCEANMNNADTFFIECKRCREPFKLTKDFSFLVLLPVCFKCQEDWINSFNMIRNKK